MEMENSKKRWWYLVKINSQQNIIDQTEEGKVEQVDREIEGGGLRVYCQGEDEDVGVSILLSLTHTHSANLYITKDYMNVR
jgi:hypothetical protein